MQAIQRGKKARKEAAAKKAAAPAKGPAAADGEEEVDIPDDAETNKVEFFSSRRPRRIRLSLYPGEEEIDIFPDHDAETNTVGSGRHIPGRRAETNHNKSVS